VRLCHFKYLNIMSDSDCSSIFSNNDKIIVDANFSPRKHMDSAEDDSDDVLFQ